MVVIKLAYSELNLFSKKNQIPSEDLQFDEYKQIVKSAKGKSVTIRTLDLGGDKILDSIGRREENPFMGFELYDIAFVTLRFFRSVTCRS